MKNKNPIHVIDIKNQVDHVSAKKIQLFKEHIDKPIIARNFELLFRHREVEKISDGNKIIKVKVNFKNEILKF